MTKGHPRIKAVALRAGRDPWRSPLFHWLKKHHARLEPALSARRIDWEPLLLAATKAGVTDDKGGDPSRHTVWRTWRKVCRVVATERAAAGSAKPSRKLQPRDLPADWRPTPLPLPAPASVSQLAAPPTVAGQPSTALVPSRELPPLTHPDQTRVIGQSLFGVITSGPLTPEPDYTGMGIAERKVARSKWHIALREPG